MSSKSRQNTSSRTSTKTSPTPPAPHTDNTTDTSTNASSSPSTDPSQSSSQPPTVVLPGDVIKFESEAKCRVGLGVLPTETGLMAATTGALKRGNFKSGTFQTGGSSLLWIDSKTKRYYPQVDDMVVGTIIEKSSEYYRVDIGLSHPAILPSLAFEGATKRNRPNLEIGALVYCRVRVVNKHMEVELTCTSPHSKKDWVTKEGMFGELTGGYVASYTSDTVRSLLDDDCPVLNALGRHIPFEIAVGANGRVWMNSAKPAHTMAIANAITWSETLTAEGVLMYVDFIAQSLT